MPVYMETNCFCHIWVSKVPGRYIHSSILNDSKYLVRGSEPSSARTQTGEFKRNSHIPEISKPPSIHVVVESLVLVLLTSSKSQLVNPISSRYSPLSVSPVPQVTAFPPPGQALCIVSDMGVSETVVCSMLSSMEHIHQGPDPRI